MQPSWYHRFLKSGAILALTLMALPLSVVAQDQFTAGGASDANAILSDGGSNEEFLKVEEAYVLSVEAEPGTLTLHWDIAPDYYLYKDNFRVKAYSDDGDVPVDLNYEPGTLTYDDYFQKELEVYYDETALTAPLPAELDSMNLAITSQGCADAGLCYPPHTEYYTVDLERGTATPITASAFNDGAGPPESDGNSSNIALLGTTLLLALLGGMLLNLMPCVFPVLSIKAMNLLSTGDANRSRRLHGWMYTAGAVVSFLAIGGIIVGIQAAGGDAGWGRQLQSPVFVALMFYLFLIMGLSLSGLVQFGTRLMGMGQSLTTRQGMQGSFFTGALAVVVASPCTAPFMAPALGVAVTQPPAMALSIFGALGLGMALPFLALSYSPKLSSIMPKPGPWMDTLKQFLAFPLYFTAVWLLWVLGRQSGIDAAATVIAGAVVIAFALWLIQRKPSSRTGKTFVYASVLLAAVFAVGSAFNAGQIQEDDNWQPYSAELVADLRAQGRPVFVNLTADWCITCHANERVALNRDSVQEKAADLNIALVEGDWTNEDPRITRLLREYQRAGVPTYLMFPADPDASPEILPQILTPGIVITAMERAASKRQVVRSEGEAGFRPESALP